MNNPDFAITSDEIISTAFRARGIRTFAEAANFIRHLPYRRNKNKSDLTTVFSDSCGTCSTKHGVLKMLAAENNFTAIELIVGLFKMNGVNTPSVTATLNAAQLTYIPEAHCYLRFNNYILDFTKPGSKPEDFVNDLVEKIIIQTNQLTDFKVAYHKAYLKKWLGENKIPYSPDEIWAIREQCIKDLSQYNEK